MAKRIPLKTLLEREVKALANLLAHPDADTNAVVQFFVSFRAALLKAGLSRREVADLAGSKAYVASLRKARKE